MNDYSLSNSLRSTKNNYKKHIVTVASSIISEIQKIAHRKMNDMKKNSFEANDYMFAYTIIEIINEAIKNFGIEQAIFNEYYLEGYRICEEYYKDRISYILKNKLEIIKSVKHYKEEINKFYYEKLMFESFKINLSTKETILNEERQILQYSANDSFHKNFSESEEDLKISARNEFKIKVSKFCNSIIREFEHKKSDILDRIMNLEEKTNNLRLKLKNLNNLACCQENKSNDDHQNIDEIIGHYQAYSDHIYQLIQGKNIYEKDKSYDYIESLNNITAKLLVSEEELSFNIYKRPEHDFSYPKQYLLNAQDYSIKELINIQRVLINLLKSNYEWTLNEKQKRFSIPIADNQTLFYPKSQGLANLGNTCFANSVIQSIYHFDAFRKFFEENSFKSEFLMALKNLLQSLANKSSVELHLKNFIDESKAFNYCIGIQQDPKEFYAFIIDKAIEEYPCFSQICVVSKINTIEFEHPYYYYEENHIQTINNVYPFVPFNFRDVSNQIKEFFNENSDQNCFWCSKCNQKHLGNELIKVIYPEVLCFYFHSPTNITIGNDFFINEKMGYKIELCICRSQSSADFGHYWVESFEENTLIVYNDYSVSNKEEKNIESYMIFCKKIQDNTSKT